MISIVLSDPETPDNMFLNSARFGIAVATNSEVGNEYYYVNQFTEMIPHSSRQPEVNHKVVASITAK